MKARINGGVMDGQVCAIPTPPPPFLALVRDDVAEAIIYRLRSAGDGRAEAEAAIAPEIRIYRLVAITGEIADYAQHHIP